MRTALLAISDMHEASPYDFGGDFGVQETVPTTSGDFWRSGNRPSDTPF